MSSKYRENTNFHQRQRKPSALCRKILEIPESTSAKSDQRPPESKGVRPPGPAETCTFFGYCMFSTRSAGVLRDATQSWNALGVSDSLFSLFCFVSSPRTPKGLVRTSRCEKNEPEDERVPYELPHVSFVLKQQESGASDGEKKRRERKKTGESSQG